MSSTTNPKLQPLKILTFALTSSSVILFLLGATLFKGSDLWAIHALYACLGMGAYGIIAGTFVLPRVAPPALTRETPQEEVGQRVFELVQPVVINRFVVSEIPLLGGLVLGFILVEGALMMLAAGLLVTLALYFRFLLPFRHGYQSVEDALDAKGVESHLVRDFCF